MNALTGLVHSMTTGPPPANSSPGLRPLEAVRRIPLGPGSTPAVPDSAWCSDSFMLGAGMVIIQEHTHKIVVVYDSHRKRWFFPRGRKDVGESVEQAALREAYEEVCESTFPEWHLLLNSFWWKHSQATNHTFSLILDLVMRLYHLRWIRVLVVLGMNRSS